MENANIEKKGYAFSKEGMNRLKEMMKDYPSSDALLLPALYIAQEEFGHLEGGQVLADAGVAGREAAAVDRERGVGDHSADGRGNQQSDAVLVLGQHVAAVPPPVESPREQKPEEPKPPVEAPAPPVEPVSVSLLEGEEAGEGALVTLGVGDHALRQERRQGAKEGLGVLEPVLGPLGDAAVDEALEVHR